MDTGTSSKEKKDWERKHKNQPDSESPRHVAMTGCRMDVIDRQAHHAVASLWYSDKMSQG